MTAQAASSQNENQWKNYFFKTRSKIAAFGGTVFYNRSIFSKNIFWFLVLVSWLPLLSGFDSVIDQINPFTWAQQGIGRKIAAPHLTGFALVSISTLLFGLDAYRSRLSIVIAGFAPSFCAAILSGVSAGTADTSTLTGMYIVCVIASVMVFAWTAHIRSIYVGVFLLLTMIEGFSSLLFNTPILLFGQLFRSYAFSLIDLIFFSIVILFFRFMMLVVKQNIEVVSNLWNWQLARDCLRSLWLWLPMLAAFLAFNWFWSTVGKEIDEAAAAYIVAGLSEAPPKPNLHTAADFVVTYAGKELEAKALHVIKASDAGANATVADLLSTSLPAIRASFPDRLMQPAGCRWYDVFCHVMNGIRSVVNSVYRKARDAALNEIERRARGLQQTMQERGDKAVAVANALVQESRGMVVTWTKDALSKLFRTISQIAILLAIYSIIILIKTYLVILSRVVYCSDKDNTRVASLRTPWVQKPRPNRASLRNSKQEFVFHERDKKSFYISSGFEVRDATPNLSVPQPLMAVVGRLLSGRYVLRYLDEKTPADDEAAIAIDLPANLVMWELREDETVVVRYADVVAFSRGVRFKTEINVSLPALIFGKFVFQQLTGPGIVIVRTIGGVVAGRDEDASHGRHPRALKAWNVNSGFQIQSNLNIVGIYLASYNIKKQENDDIVYDTSSQYVSKFGSGLLGAARTFLMPF